MKCVIPRSFSFFQLLWNDQRLNLTRTLRHPNIVLWMGIHHNTQTQELSIVTEFVPNGTLHSLLIHHDKPCPWVTRVRMALEIANALGYLHAKNILHRGEHFTQL